MSTDVSPVIPGQVVNPTAVTQSGASGPAHEFFGVIKQLIHFAGFHNQQDVINAVNAVDAYEKHVVPPSDLRAVNTEGEPAPVEDVSQRRPPTPAGVIAAQAPGQQIDYAKLAAAIVAAQAQQEGNPTS